MGGRIVGALVLELMPKTFGLDVRLQELHSTKGWKAPHTKRWRGYPPVRGAFHWVDGCGPHRNPYANVDFATIVTPRTFLRHGWYRRKLRKEIVAGIATDQQIKELVAWEARRETMR